MYLNIKISIYLWLKIAGLVILNKDMCQIWERSRHKRKPSRSTIWQIITKNADNAMIYYNGVRHKCDPNVSISQLYPKHGPTGGAGLGNYLFVWGSISEERQLNVKDSPQFETSLPKKYRKWKLRHKTERKRQENSRLLTETTLPKETENVSTEV